MSEHLAIPNFWRCPICKRPGTTPDDLMVVHEEARRIVCEWCDSDPRIFESGFPILDGIPVFATCQDDGFDYRWMQHPKPQATTLGVFTQKTGLTVDDLVGKRVLDVGVGCGRFAAISNENSRIDMWGVDISHHALEAAMRNAPHANLVRADILNLPFQDGTFDVVYSVGVLHHTKSTKRAFMEAARVVRPGGELAVWVYCKPACDENMAAVDFLHAITKACPPDKLHDAIERYALRVKASYGGRWDSLQQVLRVSTSEDEEECISDTFDWHTPQYRWYHENDEVNEWFREAGFDVVWTGDFPTSMRGEKR